MNAIQERSVSLWMATAVMPDAPMLEGDLECDVVVIGSGIAGLSTAYELTSTGEGVVVLDRGALGGGMTSRTSAHLTSNIDDLYQELIRMRGREGGAELLSRAKARRSTESRRSRRRRRSTAISRGSTAISFPRSPTTRARLKPKSTPADGSACEGVKWVDETPFPTPGRPFAACFPTRRAFIRGNISPVWSAASQRDGGRLFADTPVVSVEEDREGVVITTAGGNVVRARRPCIATNSPINDWLAIHTKQAPYRTYVIAGRVPRGAVPDALYWDTLDPYHYVRLQPGDGEVRLAARRRRGPQDRRSGRRRASPGKLEAWARSLVPALGKIEYRWSGQVLDPVDYLPFTGKNPGNQVDLRPHRRFRRGADQRGDRLARPARPRARQKQPARRDAPIRRGLRRNRRRAMISENTTCRANLAEYVTPRRDLFDRRSEARGGRHRPQGAAKLAAYRDKRGKLHVRSATLHPCRLPAALELLRDLLGLHLPRLAFFDRRRAAECTRDAAAGRN